MELFLSPLTGKCLSTKVNRPRYTKKICLNLLLSLQKLSFQKYNEYAGRVMV